MARYASKIVKQARTWLGLNEADGSHMNVISVYNAHKPLARGYTVKQNDEWCATFVSAVAISCGYTDIIPTECSCNKMIELFKGAGTWNEDDSRVPNPGDIIFYDWNDKGTGDCKGSSEHVGIVERVSGDRIIVIEGNYSQSVKRRSLSVNGRYIRGYGVPKYDKEPIAAVPVGTYTPTVKEWQKAAIADGYKFPKYGADGVWGSECESVARKAVVKKRLIYTNKNLTKIVQRVVGVDVDGKCGKETAAAIGTYQKQHGLTVDKAAGVEFYKTMLKLK